MMSNFKGMSFESVWQFNTKRKFFYKEKGLKMNAIYERSLTRKFLFSMEVEFMEAQALKCLSIILKEYSIYFI